MSKRDFDRFIKLVGATTLPRTPSRVAAMEAAVRNWFLLHPELARLEANEAGLTTCRQFMLIELQREGGPRYHIMDRLYKRFSNLRREMETHAMSSLLPAAEMHAQMHAS